MCGFAARLPKRGNSIRKDVCQISFRPLRMGDIPVGETGASCYRGRLLQGCFMQNYHIDGEIADSSCIRLHQGNH